MGASEKKKNFSLPWRSDLDPSTEWGLYLTLGPHIRYGTGIAYLPTLRSSLPLSSLCRVIQVQIDLLFGLNLHTTSEMKYFF